MAQKHIAPTTMIIKTPIKTEIMATSRAVDLHFLRLHLRLLIGLNLPVLAKYKTDKPEHQQDGSGYHQQMSTRPRF
jgi:hypothetical protein